MPPAHSPFIKVCGLTEPKNALACARAGADAIGLVFFEKSPRNVSLAKACAITRVLPETVIPWGVFVDAPFERIMEIQKACGLRAVQLHGNEPPDLLEKLAAQHLLVIKALFKARQPFLTDAENYPHATHFLVEYGKGVLPGGNAESWDYALSTGMATPKPVILAGGLTPENVTQALSLARPWGLDISSGVEKSPGIKDIGKVTEFISNARQETKNGN